MKILIIYDSFFGNTQKIAQEIKEILSRKHTVAFKNVVDFKESDLKQVEILIVGSPTRAFSPSENIKKFLQELKDLEGKGFLVFDTRADIKDVPKFVQFMIKLFGYADRKMKKALEQRGGNEIFESEGFLVIDKEGPLKKGELQKVKTWLKDLS